VPTNSTTTPIPTHARKGRACFLKPRTNSVVVNVHFVVSYIFLCPAAVGTFALGSLVLTPFVLSPFVLTPFLLSSLVLSPISMKFDSCYFKLFLSYIISIQVHTSCHRSFWHHLCWVLSFWPLRCCRRWFWVPWFSHRFSCHQRCSDRLYCRLGCWIRPLCHLEPWVLLFYRRVLCADWSVYLKLCINKVIILYFYCIIIRIIICKLKHVQCGFEDEKKVTATYQAHGL